MKKKIRRKCKCGCGEITNYGKMYVHGHYRRGRKLSAETKRKMSEANKGKKHSAETKRKISEALQDRKLSAKHKLNLSLIHQGKRLSAEHKLNISLAKIKLDPDNPYCDVWKSGEYKKDIRKDYCENVNCNKEYKRLCNHHIYLDRKKCAPIDIVTLCNPCHAILHRKLERGKNKSANPKDFIIINRPDHVSYINKKTHKIIKIKRIML